MFHRFSRGLGLGLTETPIVGGAKEHARRHNAAGFQPIKITPRRDGDFSFAYMDIPDGKSRQVRRAEHRRHVKRFGY